MVAGVEIGGAVAGVEVGGAAAGVEVGGAAPGARVAVGVAAGRTGGRGSGSTHSIKGSMDSQPLTLTHFMGQK
jgi:hypothetical protein